MKTQFFLLPWEHRGASGTVEPHAFSSVEVGGRSRDFRLKMRESIIYFKEPKRVAVYAVTKQFPRALDGDELVAAWKSEIARGNYGRFIARHLWFASVPASTVLTLVHRADGSGWIKEWFDSDWLETPPHRDGGRLELWDERGFHVANRRAIRRARPAMLQRVFPHDKAPEIQPRWLSGSEEEARRIVPHFLKLFAPTMGRHFRSFERIPLELTACSPSANGVLQHYGIDGNYFYQFPLSSLTRRAFRVLQEHLAFEEMTWINRHLRDDRRKHSYWKLEEIRAGNERFGDEWRGNFEMAIGTIRFDIAPFDIPTHHETLESLLEVRDWLDGKISSSQSAKLLAQALA